MQEDDELVRKVAMGVCAKMNILPEYWRETRLAGIYNVEDIARAAIAVMREAGWTPPIFSHALTMGSAAYKVKLGPSGNLVYEPVDLYETEKPATSEGAG